MYIVAKTERGKTLCWNGWTWVETYAEATTYRASEINWEVGNLKAQYLVEPARTWQGIRIVDIYTEE